MTTPMDKATQGRRPTNRACNSVVTPFTGTGSTKHCMTCNKWRPMAGGKKHPRTGLWQCAPCDGLRLAKIERPAA